MAARTTTAIATRPRAPTRLPDVEQIRALAQVMYQGGLCNKHCNSPDKIAVRIIAGLEVGLSPIQAVNNIMVVNGRAVIWGDAALALVRQSGKLESITETVEGHGDERVAVCVTKRKGDPGPAETRFSVADAKQANLWGKEGPWTEYTERQLMWRARGWRLRDGFGDVLSGLGIAEEELDVPTVRVGEAKSDPVKPATDPPAEVVATAVVSDELLARLAGARPSWLRSLGVDVTDGDAVKAAWADKLRAFAGVATAKHLTPEQGERLHAELVAAGHAQEQKEVFGEPATTAS